MFKIFKLVLILVFVAHSTCEHAINFNSFSDDIIVEYLFLFNCQRVGFNVPWFVYTRAVGRRFRA